MYKGVLWGLVNWFSLPALLLLLLLLVRRKLPRQFPLFCAYVIAAFVIDITRIIAYRGSFRAYFLTYWITDLLVTVFALLAICELFLNILFTRFHKVTFYRYLFAMAAVVLTIMTATTFLQSTAIRFKFIKLGQALDFLEVAVLLFFVALMLVMGRQWSRYQLGITLGFVIEASAFLTTFAAWAKMPFIHGLIDALPVIAFDLACLIWLICFLRPEKPTFDVSSRRISSELVQEARGTEENVKDWLTSKKHSDR